MKNIEKENKEKKDVAKQTKKRLNLCMFLHLLEHVHTHRKENKVDFKKLLVVMRFGFSKEQKGVFYS